MTERILKLSDIVISRYNDRVPIREIAKELHINLKTVRKLLVHCNVEIRGSKKNLIGQTFGRLLVVRYVNNDNSGKCVWECNCQCGNKHNVRGGDLVSGKIKSCGCLHAEVVRENIKVCHRKYPKSYGFKGIGDLTGGYLSQVKNRAFRYEREYSLTKEYLWDLYLAQNKKCALTGLDICFGIFGKGRRSGTREQTASLDRIDSSKGYVEGNVQWVHKHINWLKSDFSFDELLNYCKLIVEWNEKKHTIQDQVLPPWVDGICQRREGMEN